MVIVQSVLLHVLQGRIMFDEEGVRVPQILEVYQNRPVPGELLCLSEQSMSSIALQYVNQRVGRLSM